MVLIKAMLLKLIKIELEGQQRKYILEDLYTQLKEVSNASL